MVNRHIGGQGKVVADVLTTGKDAEPVIDGDHQRLSTALAREDGKGTATLEMAHDTGLSLSESINQDDYIYPTEEEKKTLRIVAGKVPLVTYTLCLVEFAERASYYGCSQVFNNFIEYPLPKGGNGTGAPPKGTQETAGALGQGLQVASALTLLFSFLAYSRFLHFPDSDHVLIVCSCTITGRLACRCQVGTLQDDLYWCCSLRYCTYYHGFRSHASCS